MAEQNVDKFVIPQQLRDLLLTSRQTVAVAESVTAGNLQIAFSLADNAMDFFQGGITAYNLVQKSRHLKVDPIHALTCNSVSEEVAAQMARRVASLFVSDWGIGITGYASPVPEKNIFQLYACFSIYNKYEEVVRKTILADQDSPFEVRLFYTRKVVDDFWSILSKKENMNKE